MNGIHLRTLAASTLTALIVSAAVSQGATQPKPLHAIGTAVISVNGKTRVLGSPSDHDRLIALMKRVDKLQNQLAETRSIALEADSAAGEAQSMTQCLTGGAAFTERADGSIVGRDAGPQPDDSDTLVVPILDDACVAA